jgi:hypothetical protein
MSDDITEERKEYLVEQAAQYIIKHDLEDFALIALEGTAPFGDIVGEMGIMMSYPLAVTFFDRFGSDFVKLFGFNYQENATLLMKRIEELSKQKKQQEKKRKSEKRVKKREDWFSNLMRELRSLFKAQNDNGD